MALRSKEGKRQGQGKYIKTQKESQTQKEKLYLVLQEKKERKGNVWKDKVARLCKKRKSSVWIKGEKIREGQQHN